MGQRSQNFIKVKLDDKEHTVCTHSQWLFGATFVRQMRNVLEFNFNADGYTKFGVEKNYSFRSEREIENLIGHLIGTNVKYGYYSSVINLNEEAKEYPAKGYSTYLRPTYQDNNDGQCFIDFTVKGKPKFCFAFPDDHTVYDDKGEDIIEIISAFKPLSAREYFNLYYTDAEVVKATSKADVRFFKDALRNIKWIENHTKLFTRDELKALYPDDIE